LIEHWTLSPIGALFSLAPSKPLWSNGSNDESRLLANRSIYRSARRAPPGGFNKKCRIVISITLGNAARVYFARIEHCDGNEAMSWTRKKLFFVAAIAACACGAAYFSIGSAPASSASLGAQWQCSRTAWILTTCTRTGHGEPLLHSSRKDPACRRARERTARV
jgi:hypothetical protein